MRAGSQWLMGAAGWCGGSRERPLCSLVGHHILRNVEGLWRVWGEV